MEKETKAVNQITKDTSVLHKIVISLDLSMLIFYFLKGGGGGGGAGLYMYKKIIYDKY